MKSPFRRVTKKEMERMKYRKDIVFLTEDAVRKLEQAKLDADMTEKLNRRLEGNADFMSFLIGGLKR